MILTLILFVLFSLSWSQESFQEFLREEDRGFAEEKKGFSKYLEEVNREFEEYKRIVNEEFSKFKREVLKHWDTYEATDRKKLVQYSPDYKIKKVFDFEKGELRVEVLGKVENFPKILKRELKEFVSQDKREAFSKDRIISSIERKIRRKFRHIRTSRIEKEPIFIPIIFGKSHISKAELEEGVRKLLSRGEIFKKRTSKGTVNVFRIKIPPKNVLRKAKQYKPIVVRESRRRRLFYPLIFAIIHTESYFNPLARSPVPAYGLMQIVPHTAGKDATKLLFGKPVILSPSYLYNAKNNIKIGTTYIYLLYYKYFKDVRDPESRLYCTIAAYNTGPGNVAFAFTRTRNLKKAIKVINAMSPRDVYNTLIRNLPYDETKNYLRKVSLRIAVYRNL